MHGDGVKKKIGVEHSQENYFDLSVYGQLKILFEENKNKVYYGRQLEVMHEKMFFHWVTSRALHLLVEERIIPREVRNFEWGGMIVLYWHSSFRYYKREAQKVFGLVESYSKAPIGAAIGHYCEMLVLEGFARLEFVLKGRNTNIFKECKWVDTGHDLDFIFEKDGIAYGVEVKNMLVIWIIVNSK